MKNNNSNRWSTGYKTAVPYTLVFGQQPCVGISNLLVDKKIMDKLHTEKELNQVTTIQFHGSLDDDHHPKSREIPFVNEFQALDGIDPNDIMSDNNDGESNADNGEGFMDINYEPSTELIPAVDATVEDSITPMVDKSSFIDDSKSMTTPKQKGNNFATAVRSPPSTSTSALLFSATTNTIATFVGINVLPAKSRAKVDAIEEPVEEHSIVLGSTANTSKKQRLNKSMVINGGSNSVSDVLINSGCYVSGGKGEGTG